MCRGDREKPILPSWSWQSGLEKETLEQQVSGSVRNRDVQEADQNDPQSSLRSGERPATKWYWNWDPVDSTIGQIQREEGIFQAEERAGQSLGLRKLDPAHWRVMRRQRQRQRDINRTAAPEESWTWFGGRKKSGFKWYDQICKFLTFALY